jgi:hypothetical protein
MGWLLHPRTITDRALWIIFFVSLITGLLGAVRLRRRTASAEAPDPNRDETKVELKLVENLLRRAYDDGDEVVISKLTEYRARLAHELRGAEKRHQARL